MSDTQIFPVKPEFGATTHADAETYQRMYARSLADPEGFWGEIAEQFVWQKKWRRVKDTSFTGDVRIRWFDGATLNITHSCVDRWAETTPTKTAIIWEGDTPGQMRHISYGELKAEVCRLANALQSLGVKKGDRVTIYLPMVPEAAYAMLACARIGAVHSVVFGGFSADSIRSRITDCDSDFVITANEGRRAGKPIALKANVDAAVEGLNVRHVLVLKVTDTAVPIHAPRDVLWDAVVPHQSTQHTATVMDAEDPLFILYTSGSTGKPKGVVHSTAGYMVYAATTTKYVFDLQPDDIYWCTADVGWITGHSYIVYGPLANGATTLMFEGVPNYPDASRFWQVVDNHKVTKFYTAPTAIRALERLGDGPVKATSRASLKLLASVGEPINPAAWLWYHDVVGEGRCPVIDTWWQTETGGHMLTPLPGATALKPGSCTVPFFGVQPELFDAKGTRLDGEGEGMLVMADSWPGQARAVWGDHARFVQTYFSQVPGKYFTSDGARRDADGYYWITGRVDDVINVSGHRLGTAEIESALVAHPKVSEAAVVGYPHDIKGQGVYAYVTLTEGTEGGDALVAELKQWVRQQIGGLAVPEYVHIT
ncbi:MAG: acetate--CoA ligase, partial [Azospirillum brasilense]